VFINAALIIFFGILALLSKASNCAALCLFQRGLLIFTVISGTGTSEFRRSVICCFKSFPV